MAEVNPRLSAALADRYRIERELGAGGMATVYLAEDLKHDRKVAIKVLKPELAAVLGAERFVVEIKTTAALSHPHILPLFDSGTANGFLFYVMPFIQGETIREKLNRETQFGVDEAVRIAREVADALDYAHRHGVIHRDIKPENILLHDGRPMVMDFGIALAVSAAAGGRMTETGLSLGTPHYMSPEQATAEKEITGRSDVYSLASVLYEMLAGQPPHIGGAAQQVIMKILTEQAAPVTSLRKSVPPNVSAALVRALEKLPADRFESAKAFADALGNPTFATSATTVAPGAVRVGGFSRAVAASTAAGILVVGTTAGAILGRRTAPVVEPPVAQFVIELPDSMSSVNWCCGPSQVLSRDGSILVFVGVRGGSRSLYRRSIGGLDAEKIEGTEGGTSPALSPDGRWLSFEAGGQLKKVPLAGGPVVPITSVVGTIAGATWVSDDSILFSSYNQGRSLWLVAAAGGQAVAVPLVDSLGWYRYPSALPGGRHALVHWRPRFRSELQDARVIAVDLKTGQVDSVVVGAVAYFARGSLLVGAADGTIFVQPFDLATRRTVGPPTALPGRASISANSLPEFAVSENGWLEYEISRGASGLERLRILGGMQDTSVVFESETFTGGFEDITIAPDGNRLLLRITTGAGGTGGDLWMLDLKASTRDRITVGGADTPVWNPDGSRVAYYFGGDGTIKPGIYVRPVDQNSAPQLVLGGADLIPNSFTPDGRSVAFCSCRVGDVSDIGIVSLGDTTVRWIVKTEFAERQPQISHDGTRLAYTSNRTQRNEVYVQSMSGNAVAVPISTNGGSAPRWARDGRLFYIDLGGQIHAVTIPVGPGIVVTKRTIESRAAANADMNVANVNWDLFPDSKRMVIIDQGGGIGTRRIALIQNWPALASQMGAKK
jgi:eukaryotic-like serine/threonine-protein kinase